MHSVLGRQLKKLDIDPSQLPSAESWKALLERISLTYAQADQDRYMLERSLATSSSEMQSLYDQLRSATELELGKKQVELANSLALAHAVQESVAEAIVVCDGTEVLTWNRRFIELWAISNDVLVTRDMHAFVQHARSQGKDGGAFADMATLALMNPAEVRRCDVELLDGRTFARYVAPIALTGDHSRGRVICYRDVTEERRDAAQRRIAEHVAAVGQLVASVAHEINNPLSYVTGNVDLVTEEIARRGRPEDAPMVEALEDASIGVTRITAVVRDLGTLSRSDEEHVAPVDMRAVVESALKMVQNQLHHHTRIVRRFDDIPPVMGNEARLGQVLLNLLINAAHALPEGRANEMHTQVQRERPELLERFVFMSGGAFTPTLRSFFENVQARASRIPSRIVSSRASSTASHGSVASADQPE